MNTFGLLLLATLLLAGCHSKSPVSEGEAASTNLFKQGKGVLWSEQTTKLLGIAVAEVAEKSLTHDIEKAAQVYYAGAGSQPSRALLHFESEETPCLKEGQATQIKSISGEKRELPARLARIDTGTVTVVGRVEGILE